MGSGKPAWEIARRYFWNKVGLVQGTLDIPDYYNWARHSTITGRAESAVYSVRGFLDWFWTTNAYELTDAYNAIDGCMDSRSITWNAGAGWSFRMVGEYTIVLPQTVIITKIGVRAGGWHAHEDSGCIICSGDRKRHPRILLDGNVFSDSRNEGPEMEYGKSSWPSIWWFDVGGVAANTVGIDIEYYSAGLNYLGEQSLYEVVIFGAPTVPLAGPAFSTLQEITSAGLERDIDADLLYGKEVTYWHAGYWDMDEGVHGCIRVSDATPTGTSLLATDHNNSTALVFDAWVQGVGFSMEFAQVDLGDVYFVEFMYVASNRTNMILWGSEDGQVWYEVRGGFHIDTAVNDVFQYHWTTDETFGRTGNNWDYSEYTFPVLASGRYWRLGFTPGTFCGGLAYVGAKYLRSWEIYGGLQARAGLGWGCQSTKVDASGHFSLSAKPVQATLQVYDHDGRLLVENKHYEKTDSTWLNYRFTGRSDLRSTSVVACYLHTVAALRSQPRGVNRDIDQNQPTDRVRVNDIRGF